MYKIGDYMQGSDGPSITMATPHGSTQRQQCLKQLRDLGSGPQWIMTPATPDALARARAQPSGTKVQGLKPQHAAQAPALTTAAAIYARREEQRKAAGTTTAPRSLSELAAVIYDKRRQQAQHARTMTPIE